MKKIIFLLISLGLYSQASAEVVFNAPYFNDTDDVSSYGAVENGGVYSIVDHSVYFDGYDAYVSYPNASQYTFTNGFFVEMDYKPTTSAVNKGIIGKWSYQPSPYDNNEWVLLQQADGTILLVLNTDTGISTLASDTVFAYNTWAHISFGYDETNMYIYVNGILDSSVAKTGEMVGGNANINVGAYSVNQGENQAMWGYLKNLRIYNTPLPPGGSCETITQPSTVTQSILNRGSVQEIDTGNEIYKAVSAGTGTYIQLGNVKDVVDFVSMIENTVPMTLKSSNALIGNKPRLYIQGANGITSIDLTHSDLGEITLYRYNKSNSLLSTHIYNTSSKINITKADAVVIEWEKSFFEYRIESIYIDTQTIIGSERELCEIDGNYTLDGEPYVLGSTGSLSEISTPPTDEWTFTTSGYTFYNNGFCLQNFVPYPHGGNLSFDIISPDGTMQNTGNFGPYESDGNGYGFDSCVKVTTFFHEIAGVYKVRVKYSYAGESIYPFGTDYNNYTISLPESNDNENIDWNYEACNGDQETTGWLPGVSNFFNCLSSTISQFMKDSYSNMTKAANFIKSLGGFFTLEEKSPMSYIIPGVYANGEINILGDFSIRDNPEYKESPLGKIDKVFKGFMITIFVIISLILIASRRKNDNNK